MNVTEEVASLRSAVDVLQTATDVGWVLISGTLVILMQLGFAMREALIAMYHSCFFDVTTSAAPGRIGA